MKVAFWSNGGGGKLGIGHLMRCLALANALKENKITSYFISKEYKQGIDLISSKEFETRLLPKETTSSQDLSKVIELSRDASLIVTDSHQLTTKDYRGLKETGKIIAVIDDVMQQVMPVDVVIGNAYAENKDYLPLVLQETTLLLGPKYIPLRSRFHNIPDHQINKELKHLLITMGGEDPMNCTRKVMQALALYKRPLTVDVVLGPAYSFKDTLQNISLNPNHTFIFHEGVKDMLPLYEKADAAILAPGMTLWEMARAYLPMIIMQTMDNQTALANYAKEKNLGIVLGWHHKVDDLSILEALKRIEDQKLRISMSHGSKALIDGMGAFRIADALIYSHMIFKTPNLDPESIDSKLIWEWRNDLVTRKMSKSSDFIPFKDHVDWYKNLSNQQESILLIGYLDKSPLCVIRFDREEDQSIAEISINTNPSERGKGLGTISLNKALSYARDQLQLKKLKATIKKQNTASIKAFESAGYIYESAKEDLLFYTINLSH